MSLKIMCRWGIGLILASIGIFGGSCDRPQPSATRPNKPEAKPSVHQQFEGITLTVTGLKYPIGNAFEAHAEDFEKMTGVDIVFETVPFGNVYDAIAKDYETGENRYEVIVYPPIWLPDLIDANYLSDLTSRVDTDAALEWDDIVPFFRDYGNTYDNKIYGIPVDGDYYMLYYRRDVLEKAGLQPPTRWEDYLAIAKQFHGQDLNDDGTPDYGSCLTKQSDHVSWWVFWSIAGSYLQSQGTRQGGFFDPDTMQPLTNNEAFAKALDIYQQTGQYASPDEWDHSMDDARDLFISGRCVLTMDHGNTGTLTIAPDSQVVDKVATALLPGATEVLDRTTGKLVSCDKFTCPFAIDGVNHAPYAALIGWSAGVNAAAPPEVQDAAYAFISYVSQPAQANVDVTIGETGFNPYRISQLTDTQSWVDAGMSLNAANQYLGGISASLSNPNMMLDLIIPNNDRYQQHVLDKTLAAFLAGDISRDQAMAKITSGWDALTDEIGRQQQKTVYRTGLGLNP